ncbi:tetratricopeptide repeat protein [Bradyrhizobium sp. CB1717]|uniref:O-linked N-acetylglucosamine transferase family protein n=1 Tax=Bradyrhizobium sp. CB1717 TaxID=3039154 RepID=UPI0024B27232|nr:tetratricopeptide repeat protein [Bradyrhizobium sp. CB1717]WFU28641.1 tetratricopeptide repeat protein [Bradyrhizobium sp. CB1717]
MANELQAKFRRAVDAFQGRDLAKAEKILEQIRRSSPNIFDVEHFLGVIKLMQGRFSEAEVHLKAAVGLNGSSDEALSNYGYALKSLNRPQEALTYFSRALAVNPRNPLSYHNRGSILAEFARDYSNAIDQFDKAIAYNPNFADAYVSKGNCLEKLQRYEDALVAYDKALAIKPDLENAWLGRGNALRNLKRHDEAFATYDRALSGRPGFGDAWIGRGDVLADLERHDEALAAYDKALAIKPDLANAWVARGHVLWGLARYDDALAAYDKALSIKPDLEGAWLGRGNVCYDLKRYDAAFAAYDKTLSIRPDLAEAWLGRGNVLTELKRYDDASAAYERALSIKPDLAEAWLGQGNVAWGLKRYEDALAAFDKALSIKPGLEGAWIGRGNVFTDLRRFDEALAAYDKALSIKPDLEGIEGLRLYTKMHLCNWDHLEEEISHLTAAIRAGKANSSPFALLSLTDSPDDHLRCARAWVAAKLAQLSKPGAKAESNRHDRIRVGYVSPDLREHPVGYLTAGIFESHDTDRFETYAFSIGPGDNSDLRKRLEGSFHRFIDCQHKNDSEVLQAIKDAGIDILVDLAGHTHNARLSLFASGPAPIVVNYLGFAGTLGSKDLAHYIIADKVVLPESSDQFFEEKVVRLPGSFMPRDSRGQAVDQTTCDRADHDLRPEWTVFCCFNNAYKINPSVFGSWMNILKSVDLSVLWLSDMGEMAKSNLRKEAGRLGIDPDRLVFAKRLSSSSDHLARHRLADLFLDTLPYNAHTTASDALWAGLPVLTQVGNGFAGRVAASLLEAAGLRELIARTREEYEALAIDLVRNKQRLQAIRNRLQENRTTSLFDAPLYTKHLEAAYEAMLQRHRAGLPPDQIEIQALG